MQSEREQTLFQIVEATLNTYSAASMGTSSEDTTGMVSLLLYYEILVTYCYYCGVNHVGTQVCPLSCDAQVQSGPASRKMGTICSVNCLPMYI